MDREAVLGAIGMMLCGFGCGGLFYCLGVWSSKRKDPMGFWAGTVIDPQSISDIPAYNQANARMWKLYSLFYWISGILGILVLEDVRFALIALIPMVLACTIGMWWLIRTYKKIEKQYKIQNS